MFPNVIVDLPAPHPEQWTNDLQSHVVDLADGNCAHGAEPARAGATEKINQESFDKIIGVMAEENRSATPPLCDLREEFVASVARGGFDRHFLFHGKSPNICRPEGKIDIVICSKFLDEDGVGPAGSAAELMIEMANDQVLV